MRSHTRIAALLTLCLAVLAGCAGAVETGGPRSGPTTGDTGVTRPVNGDTEWVAPDVTGPDITYRVEDATWTTGPAGQDCASVVGDMPEYQLQTNGSWVKATRCVETEMRVHGDGEWLVRLDQEATSGLNYLDYALRLPDEQPYEGMPTCPSRWAPPNTLMLIDSLGNVFHPRLPTGPCGFETSSAVSDALAEMNWTTVSISMIRQLAGENNGAPCPGGYDPVVTLVANGADVNMQPPVELVPLTLAVCRYVLNPEPALGYPDAAGRIHLAGRIDSVKIVDRDAATQLLSAVNQAPPATACDEPDGPFAVILPDGGTSRPWLYVELGGCYRAVVEGERSVRQLDRETVKVLW